MVAYLAAHECEVHFITTPPYYRPDPLEPDVVLCIASALMNNAPFVLVFAHKLGSRSWLHIQDFEMDAALNLGILSGKNLSLRRHAQLSIFSSLDLNTFPPSQNIIL